MKRIRWSWLVTAQLLFIITSSVATADEPKNSTEKRISANQRDQAPPQSVHTEPWASLWMSSLERMTSAIDVIYRSADRPELAETVDERFTSYRGFSGIDRKRPLGLMWTWDNVEPAATIFLPIQNIDELMKTATFDVVEFHKVSADQYEIERPGSPYHVVLRSGFALFGEDVEAMRALRQSPDQLTKPLRDKYDAALHLDLKQIPRETKINWIDTIQSQVEPWLQRQDGEPIETAKMRRAVGGALLAMSRQLVLNVNSATLGGRLEKDDRRVVVELIIESEPRSDLAGTLNRLVTSRSEFSALVNDNAAVGLAINWPLESIGNELLSQVPNELVKGLRIDAGLQIVGSGRGNSSIIVGLRGPEAAALNGTIPKLLLQLDKSPLFSSVTENFDIHRAVVLHSLTPREAPELLRRIAGDRIECLIGQGRQIVWLAAGNPDVLPEQLRQAINAVEDQSPTERPRALIQGRFAFEHWGEIASPNGSSPQSNPPSLKEDGLKTNLPVNSSSFRLSVEPVTNGLKFRFVAEEPLLRMIGQEWAKQIDDAQTAN